MNRHSENSRTAGLNHILLIAALMPASGFFGWFALSVLQQKSISFSRGDLLVCGLPGLLLLVIATVRKTPSTLARLALIQWSLLLVVVPVELGLRMAFRHPPAPWGINTVREITLSVPLEGVAAKGTFTTNELGLRGRPMPLSRLKGVDLSVLCVGGSTTECFYNSDEHAWPAVMEQKIAEKTSGEAFVGNAGRGGHIARHHAWQLKHYRYAPEFKIVAVLCGWNDLSAALFATPDAPARDIAAESLTRGIDFTALAEPHTPFYRNLATGRLLQQAVFRRQWNPSANVGWRAVIQDSYGRWVADRREIRKNCIAAGALTSEPADFEMALKGFRADLEAILAALHPGQVPVLITQPTLCRSGLTPEEQSRLWSCDGKRAWTAESTAVMLKRINEVTRDFCRLHDLTCVDAELAMSGNSKWFYDDCHFSDAGCAQLGTLVAEHVVAVAEANGLLKNN